ncbi:MAG: hypothetical protein ABJ263_17300 [Tateyamaria sp.]|uniref:hypothetical protein n=1 Tax=Tateyamaria sp. TaxID=1929288 RepID=UPI0032924F67
MKICLISIGFIAALPLTALAQTMPTSALGFLDADDDVQVTREEILQQMDLFFEPMDANGDSRLEFDEVEGFMSRDIFDNADENGNGSISKPEYREQVLKDFDAADVDGDGVLD